MTDSIKQKLCKVLDLCVEINTFGCDCKFYCNSQCFFVYLNNNYDIIDINNEYNIDQTIQKLEAFKSEWSNKK